MLRHDKGSGIEHADGLRRENGLSWSHWRRLDHQLYAGRDLSVRKRASIDVVRLNCGPDFKYCAKQNKAPPQM